MTLYPARTSVPEYSMSTADYGLRFQVRRQLGATRWTATDRFGSGSVGPSGGWPTLNYAASFKRMREQGVRRWLRRYRRTRETWVAAAVRAAARCSCMTRATVAVTASVATP